ncbi:MAG: nuclear transport factor 2 family protein [Chitinophagales bacterium]|nr:nuclear transport factor 2 family protein [Chitinophagales bacterium]MBP9548735.1 nuclear transport factor 2 family protein [Chitinophagales bacterium]MBP9703164.1 nuclear transport factor 2 family protein [Chitinophagales bacterium]
MKNINNINLLTGILMLSGVILFALPSHAHFTDFENKNTTMQSDTSLSADEIALQHQVILFLRLVGTNQLDSLPAIFMPGASIGVATYFNEAWHVTSLSFEEFMKNLQSRSNPAPNEQVISNYTIHIDGYLAFVRAEAVLMRDGKALSNNMDYFTLLKDRGEWKFVNASYAGVPVKE